MMRELFCMKKYADITIAEDGLNVEQTIEKIVAQIQKESL